MQPKSYRYFFRKIWSSLTLRSHLNINCTVLILPQYWHEFLVYTHRKFQGNWSKPNGDIVVFKDQKLTWDSGKFLVYKNVDISAGF